jgi:6-phosphogluconolactonase
MATNTVFHEFADSAILVENFSSQVASLLSSAIKKKNKATLVVSGGSTPVPFFAALARKDIDWARVTITLADERWVPAADQASNELLVRSHLLRHRAESAGFVGLYTGTTNAEDGEKECESRILAMNPPFDVLVLGMGNDGHTASLFPQAENLKKATDMKSGRLCMAMISPAAPHERMTLTLPALLKANNIFLHITGQEKRKVFDKALAAGPEEEMPVRFILSRTAVPVQIYWAP